MYYKTQLYQIEKGRPTKEPYEVSDSPKQNSGPLRENGFPSGEESGKETSYCGAQK